MENKRENIPRNKPDVQELTVHVTLYEVMLHLTNKESIYKRECA